MDPLADVTGRMPPSSNPGSLETPLAARALQRFSGTSAVSQPDMRKLKLVQPMDVRFLENFILGPYKRRHTVHVRACPRSR